MNSNVVIAQTFGTKVYNVEQGLSQSQVTSLCEDRRGYLWMGTNSGGVSRFDGRKFKTFTVDQGLLGNAIGAIAEDPLGNLWFACDKQGLCYYDGYKFHPVGVGKINFESANRIFFSRSGSLWLTTEGDGLFELKGGHIQQFLKKDGLSSDSVFRMIEGPQGELWAGTANGICVIKAGEIHPLDTSSYADLPQGSVRDIIRLRDGSMMGSNGLLIWRLRGKEFDYDTLPLPIGTITSVLEDHQGNIWMTGGHLAARYTKDGFHRLGIDDGLKESRTNVLLQDRNGNAWIGSNGSGAICYSSEAFTTYGANTPFEDHGIFSIAEIAPNHLFVGTERGLFELKQGAITEVKDFPSKDANIFTMLREPSGSILITSSATGLLRSDGKKFQQLAYGSDSRNTFYTAFIPSLTGALYPNPNGLYDIGPDSIRRISLDGIALDKNPFLGLQDRSGRYWLAFSRMGLHCWDHGKITNLDAAFHLQQRDVYDLDEDKNGAIWVSTIEGLLRFKDGEACYINSRDGLSGNVVYLLQADANGDLWAGTENGLTRIKIDQNSNPIAIDTYGKAEGFTGIECNQGASMLDSEGKLWFGTIQGLSCYHPERDFADTLAPHIEITDFRIKLEKIDWTQRGFAITPWTNIPINAVLDPHEDDVRIDFAGITQHLGEKVTYRYVLEGLDTAYSEPTTESYRVYSPLPPGSYTFKVIACNADGVWTKVPATLSFKILAPFWKTTLFRVLFLFAIIAILLGTIRLRTNNLQRQRAILELKVKQRTEALEQANQVKGEFLAKMSHEIRTPMNGVIGMTDLLERTALTPQQRKFVENIRVSGQSLLSLINDILDFSRIESGKLEMERIPFDLRHTMEEVLDILSFTAFSKGLELLYWVDPEIRGPVLGDPSRIKQILTNLVGNAIKFTSTGEIILRARLIELEDDIAVIQCSIKDSGIGIPKEKHATLFESFTQVDASTTRKYGGTGLGLAISYNLSRMMGGEMWLESEMGQGSEFHFTIKVGTSGPWNFPGDAHPAKSLEGKQIVAALKHPATEALLTEYLQHWGVVMHTYDNIQAATDAALDIPDIAFLLVDLRLSHGDPALFVQRIESICASRGLRYGLMAEPDVSIPLSTFIGPNGWILPKPFKRDDLLAALIGHRLGNEVQATGESLSQLASQVPLRILVAEDNPINQDVVQGMLGSLGYTIQIAQDGKEALEIALQGGIDLIFMDVQMPVMDGLEATRQIIARMPADKRPIIVAMTANAMESDRKNCLEAGMQTFISKPFLMNELVRMLRTVPAMRSGKISQDLDVHFAQQPIPANLQAVPLEAQPTAELQAAPASVYRLTDMSMLESVSGGEPEFVLGILNKLVAKMPEAVQELRAAAAIADWEIVRATAHRNKSSAAYSGSEMLKEKFKELEALAREQEELELIPTKLDELHLFVDAVIEELRLHIAERST